MLFRQVAFSWRGRRAGVGVALRVSRDHASVIDGATPKDARTWDSMPADVFVAGCLAQGMERLSARDDCRSALPKLNKRIVAFSEGPTKPPRQTVY